MDLQDFLVRNKISRQDFEASNISWLNLYEIYEDYILRRQGFESVAEFVVKQIQSLKDVHSVRWRLKSPEHLLEKIIRKRCESNPSKKYLNISVKNYTSVVTDLIGVRALHLFKDQVFTIHEKVIEIWATAEKPVSYIREGDHADLVQQFKKSGINTKVHKAGYRSVHYVLKMKPGLIDYLAELQVRTIFEEGWSEIDHKIRYPNFSDNKQIESVLKIFNRIAGSADELGGFVRDLSVELDDLEANVLAARQSRDESILEMQRLVSELSNEKASKEESLAKASLLQAELNKVKSSLKEADRPSLFGMGISPGHFIRDGKVYEYKLPARKRRTLLGKEE
jgi:ppGpp synthetase/RelA/SpoT-type nucleotidyltranferase